jgi:hypothetical protein
MATPRLSKLASDYGGDLLLPVATLVSGGSKIAAGMQLVGGIIVTKVLGPLGAVAGIMSGIIVSLVKWEQTAQLVARAMDKAAAKEAMTKQFAELTKSVATAKARLQDLFQFAEKSPFRFESVIEGGKALQQLTKGALITQDNLKLVGDVAAASGQQFGTAAEKVGAFYGDLQDGRPVRASAEELRNMGVISQTTVERVVALQAAGAGLSSTWNIARADLEKAQGAMQGVSQTIEDLQGKKETTKAGIVAPAGQIYNDGMKRGLEAQNQLLEKAAPVLTQIFQIVARVSVGFGYLQSGIVRMIGSIPGLTTLLGGLSIAFATLATSALALSALKLAAFFRDSALGLNSYAASVRRATAETEDLTKATILQTEAERIAANAAGPAISGTYAAEQAEKAGAQKAVIKMKTGARSVGGGLSTIFQGAQTAFNEARRPAGSFGPELPPNYVANVASAGAKEAVVGTEAVAMGAGAKLATGAVKLLGEGVSYLAKGLGMLFTGAGAVVSVFAVLAVGATILWNKYETASEAIKTFNDATAESVKQLKQQSDNIQTATDQAAAYQKAIELVKTGQDELNAAMAEKSSAPVIGGLLDYFNQVDGKIKAAKDAIAQGTGLQTQIKGKQGLALSDDQNKQVLDFQLGAQQAAQQRELVGVSPERQAAILQQRADAAAKEQAAQIDVQKRLAQQQLNLTPEQQTAMGSEQTDQKAVDEAKAKEDAEKARLVNANKAGRRVNTDSIRSDIAKATADREKAEASAAQNASLRNGVNAAQTGIMATYGGEQGKINAQLAQPDLTQEKRQELGRQLVVTQARLANPAEQEAQAASATQQLGISKAQSAAEAPILAEQAKAVQGAPFTPEEELESQQKITDAKKDQLDQTGKLNGMTQDQIDQAKQALDTEQAGRKQALEYRTKQAEAAKKLQDIDQAVAEINAEALGTAKDQWGTLQDQVRAIQARKDLTKEEQANAIQLLKISQEQAALEAYRSQEATKLAGNQLRSQALLMTGHLAESRQLENQSSIEAANNRQKEREAQYTAQNIAGGKYASNDAAKASAIQQAADDRKNDALDSFLAKNKEIADMTKQTAVGPIAPNSVNKFTPEEAEAGRQAGFGVSDNDVDQDQKSPARTDEYPAQPRPAQQPESPQDESMREQDRLHGAAEASTGTQRDEILKKMLTFGGSDSLPSANRPQNWIYDKMGPGASQQAAASKGNIPQLGGPSPLDAPEGGGHHGMGSLGHEGLGAQKGGGRHFGMDAVLGAVAKPASSQVKPTDPLLTENQKQTGLLTVIATNSAKWAASSSEKKEAI